MNEKGKNSEELQGEGNEFSKLIKTSMIKSHLITGGEDKDEEDIICTQKNIMYDSIRRDIPKSVSYSIDLPDIEKDKLADILLTGECNNNSVSESLYSQIKNIGRDITGENKPIEQVTQEKPKEIARLKGLLSTLSLKDSKFQKGVMNVLDLQAKHKLHQHDLLKNIVNKKLDDKKPDNSDKHQKVSTVTKSSEKLKLNGYKSLENIFKPVTTNNYIRQKTDEFKPQALTSRQKSIPKTGEKQMSVNDKKVKNFILKNPGISKSRSTANMKRGTQTPNASSVYNINLNLNLKLNLNLNNCKTTKNSTQVTSNSHSIRDKIINSGKVTKENSLNTQEQIKSPFQNFSTNPNDFNDTKNFNGHLTDRTGIVSNSSKQRLWTSLNNTKESVATAAKKPTVISISNFFGSKNRIITEEETFMKDVRSSDNTGKTSRNPTLKNLIFYNETAKIKNQPVLENQRYTTRTNSAQIKSNSKSKNTPKSPQGNNNFGQYYKKLSTNPVNWNMSTRHMTSSFKSKQPTPSSKRDITNKNAETANSANVSKKGISINLKNQLEFTKVSSRYPLTSRNEKDTSIKVFIK